MHKTGFDQELVGGYTVTLLKHSQKMLGIEHGNSTHIFKRKVAGIIIPDPFPGHGQALKQFYSCGFFNNRQMTGKSHR